MTDRVADIVTGLVREYIDKGCVDSAYEINCGWCSDFADDLIGRAAQLQPVPSAQEVWVDDLLMDLGGDGIEVRFDLERISERYPEIALPAGISWADMDVIARDYGFAGGSHVWSVIDGRHYDAETPNGVVNPFDLPYFVRVMEHYQTTKNAAVPLKR